ncbi:hypothetical protein O3G_MSEX004665 [Manduca sexta]|uniref:Transcription factor Adf-1 n=1 Tax=Manduca sexta TaxID=7130 RepID=A0A922CI25_MANSE|nr:hypothetical protein O3G_MSEX004665 [Manduca sexta]
MSQNLCSGKMSFSPQDEEKLINIVAKHPVIFDTGHANYRNKSAKEKVWAAIGEELNKNCEDCKKQWKLIRDGYNRFKKTRKSSASDAPKHSKDQRHKQLFFLDGIIHHRSGGSIVPESPPESIDNEENVDSSEVNIELGESKSVFLSCNYEADHNVNQNSDNDQESSYSENQNSDNNTTETVNDAPKRKGKPKSKLKRFKRTNVENNLLKKRKERDQKRQTLLHSIAKKKCDDVEYFCRHIAEVLRQLPPVEKARAKQHLNSVLSEYEIMAARNTVEGHNSTSTYFSPESCASPSSNSAYQWPGTSSVQQVHLPNITPKLEPSTGVMTDVEFKVFPQ